MIHSLGDDELSVDEILKMYKLLYKQVYKSKGYFKRHTIQPALLEGYVEMIYPDKPNHPKQKYRLTAKGLGILDSLIKLKRSKMYTEEEYEDYKSWREDMEFMDRYMDELDRILDEQIQNHNEALEEDERRK
mgnify:CR=1 FL=1